MTGILADNDVGGQLDVLVGIWQSPVWHDTWIGLGLTIHSFPDLKLSSDAPDSLVWTRCQEQDVVLVTGNRNDDGPDSLAATIRNANTPNSLPVFTLADPRKIGNDKRYPRQVAQRLLEYLMDIEQYRGVGRLYLP